MIDNIPSTPSASLTSDEKATPVMFYTAQSMVWGKVVSKTAIRINTWLHTDMVPDYYKVLDAQLLLAGQAGAPRPQAMPVAFLHTQQILAFHLMPPASEPMDFDPNEPNRKMFALTAVVGLFQFDGYLRMSQHSDPGTFLNSLKGIYVSFYDARMTCPALPQIKGIETPLVLIRQSSAIFSPR
jgi:hypothetical protein